MQISRKKRRGVSCQLAQNALRHGVLIAPFSLFFPQIIEKRRRDRINNCLVELRRLVPAAFEKQVGLLGVCVYVCV